MISKSLHARHNELASAEKQLSILANGIFQNEKMPTFKTKLEQCGHFPLKPSNLEILQINVGYMCNQVCSHCHVDAGPDRKEIMTQETMQLCIDKIKETGVHTLDITGGAPEMNPHFRWLVEEASKLGVEDIIVRSNLTIIKSNKKFEDLPCFFALNKVHVVSSLPFYAKSRTDKQRGEGVFDKSIEALRMLNAVGYGNDSSGLQLDLVYNPAGAFLPADQSALEKDFKENLLKDFEVKFNRLFALTNLPISRFLEYLIASDNYEDYMELLIANFNPGAVENVMCRNTLSIGWDGRLYDCDFNQMLGLQISTKAKNIKDFNTEQWQERSIVISQHCFGCTAGAGSSCQGTIA